MKPSGISEILGHASGSLIVGLKTLARPNFPLMMDICILNLSNPSRKSLLFFKIITSSYNGHYRQHKLE